jgi:hypothetical protein
MKAISIRDMRTELGHLDQLIAPELEQQIFATFSEDIELGYLSRHPVSDHHNKT